MHWSQALELDTETRMLPFFRRQWFLLSLVGVFALGFCFPQRFAAFANAKTLRNCIVATVLFIMALPLDTKSVALSIWRPWPALLASLVNMCLLPLVAWILSRALVGDMRVGLLVAASVPCTLASAAVWTRRAGGDDTVALLVTAATNITCFLTTPFLLYATTGSEMSAQHQADLARMPIRLALLVVLPMALGQLVRQQRRIGEWSTRQKPLLSTVAQAGILSMVLSGATVCGLKLSETNWLSLAGFPLMCGLALALHVFVLFSGMKLASLAGFSRPQQIAVGIAGSQKTLMVGLDIAISYFGGLAILPMVVYHFIQLFADTVIADRLRSRNV